MVVRCSDAAISVVVKLRTKMLDKISAIVLDMFHLITYTIGHKTNNTHKTKNPLIFLLISKASNSNENYAVMFTIMNT